MAASIVLEELEAAVVDVAAKRLLAERDRLRQEFEAGVRHAQHQFVADVASVTARHDVPPQSEFRRMPNGTWVLLTTGKD